MPMPLHIVDLTDMQITVPRSASASGWKYTIWDIDDVINFGNVFDNANVFTDGSSSAQIPIAIKIKAELDAAANFAIQDFDVIKISYRDVENIERNVNIKLPAESGSANKTWYIDSDGNTWTDIGLTTPAGGVLVFSDTVTSSESMGNDQWAISENDDLKISDKAEISLLDLTPNFKDNINIFDTITFGDIQSLTLNFNDHIHIDDRLKD